MLECMMAVLDVLVGSNEYLECWSRGWYLGRVRPGVQQGWNLKQSGSQNMWSFLERANW